MRFFSRYITDESGAPAAEYALLAAGIALAIVVVLFAFSDQLQLTFESMEPALSNIANNIPQS